MAEFSDVERRVCEVVRSIPGRAKQAKWKSDKIWTQEIKTALGRVARDHYQFYVCASGCEGPNQGEWLYDMVWLQNDDPHVVAVPLVLESEWSVKLKDIMEDFQKLLLARAEHRVMIFQQETTQQVYQVVEKFEAQVSAFRGTQPRDRYLLLGFDWATTGQFTSHLLVK
jgi:hypothetical protein